MSNKILLIEDDPAIGGLTHKKLLSKGVQVSWAIDGEKGLKAIYDEKPDLILLDLILPNVDGFEILTKKQNDASIAKIPVIVLSNLYSEGDMDKCLKLGAIGYFVKAEVFLEEVIAKIETVLKDNSAE
jgi:DNA-binding response OmpR family regulator